MIEQLITLFILILAVLLIRQIFEKHISQRLKYALWLLVVIKLLIPVSLFESDISVMNVVRLSEDRGNTIRVKPLLGYTSSKGALQENSSQESLSNKKSDKAFTKNNNISDNAVPLQKAEPKNPSAPVSAHKGNTAISVILLVIWGVGGLVLSICIIVSNMVFYHRLKSDRKRMKECPYKIPVYQTALVSVPCLFGILKPGIYIPLNNQWTESQCKYILTHEVTHYKQLDHIWSLVRCICVIIYWFHPLVWFACFLSAGDSELSCDEGVLLKIGDNNRLDYGKMLIELATENDSRSNILLCTASMSGDKRNMKKRISMIAGKTGKRLAATFVFILLTAGVVGCTFTGEKSSDKKSSTEVMSQSETGDETVRTGNRYGREDIVEERENIPENDEGSELNSVEWNGVELLTELRDDQICIEIRPAIGGNNNLGYYYIPNEASQEILKQTISNVDFDKGEPEEILRGKEEMGYSFIYDGWIWIFYSDACILCEPLTYEGEQIGETVLVDEYFWNFVTDLLAEDLDYQTIRPEEIHDIVSATLEYQDVWGDDDRMYSQTIKDKQVLSVLEDWLSNAEYVRGGSSCPFNNAVLSLTLKNGREIKLSMADDSCPMFIANGVFYDYRPVEFRKISDTSTWTNDPFFEYFDEIPKKR